jgi:UPF0755 protein
VSRRPDEEWASIEPAFSDEYDALTRRRTERRPPRKARARRRRVGFLLLAVVAFVLGLGAGYARGYFMPGEEGALVTVTIPEGATLTAIGEALEEEGVVKHARAFIIKAQSDGYSTQFKPGTYRFHQNEPYETLVAGLVKGVRPPSVKVTIPEGSTLRQTADLVAGAVPTVTRETYIEVARDEPPPLELQGYRRGTTLEGMLFPATYEVDPKARAAAVVDAQLEAFARNFAEVDRARARKANLTDYDVVIIASMVEREARVAAERPLVAAVIWNRLRKDMLLQIDATIQYALGETKPELTYDDLEIDSPYNTYRYAGLPPTPIANPGLAALQAAAAPADVDYLYYVARNDGTGKHDFTASYEQFLVDKAKAAARDQ